MDRHPQTALVAKRCRFVGVAPILAIAAVLTVAWVSPASAADDSLAVLGIEAIEVGDALGVQLTDLLRHKAADTQGVRLVTGKDLIELKMVFGCDGEAPACLAQAGRSLGADRLLYGTLKKAEGGKSVAVSLKLLDVRDLVVVKQVNETVPKRTFVGPTLAAEAARWFGMLILPPQFGVIVVQSQPADAAVDLDGTVAGRTPLRLKDLRPGSHTVTLQLDGYTSHSETVELLAGAAERVNVKLEREQRVEPTRVVPTQPEPSGDDLRPVDRKPRHPGRAAKYAAIGLVAGSVIAGAVAIYTWRSYISLQDQAHSDLQSIAASPGTMPDTAGFLAKPGCDNVPFAPSSLRDSYSSHCASGNRFASATTGLWITAGVLATAGIVSYIVGNRLDARAATERRKGVKESLRLLPAISTTGGGLQASFEF